MTHATNDPTTASDGMPTDVRLIAFYLPQFHPIPENDGWWGKGFTEWTNVARARPQFRGHAQPRLPADLGYYDLRVPEVREQQADLARAYGIHGFCYYYYWFNGKRLLERPLDEVLASGRPDFPFCLCWANENWTRRWDGLDQEILIGQAHSPESDAAFFRDALPALRDRRYIRVNGAPLLVVYRPQLLPSPCATMDRWRRLAESEGLGPIHLAGTNAFDFADPVSCGLDSLIEFPPHTYPTRDYRARVLGADAQFAGVMRFYEDVVREALARPTPAYRLFRGVMARWDNTPRRGRQATIYWGATPAAYEAWLRELVARARAQRVGDERLVFINAWNEWAEGAHLEPDQRFGHGFLEATRRALLPAEAGAHVGDALASNGDHASVARWALDASRAAEPVAEEICAAARAALPNDAEEPATDAADDTHGRLVRRCAALDHDLAEAQAQIAAMKRSYYWRLREWTRSLPGALHLARRPTGRNGQGNGALTPSAGADAASAQPVFRGEHGARPAAAESMDAKGDLLQAWQRVYRTALRGQQPDAVILNPYMNTLGGGEMSALWYYRALRDLGYRPVIATPESPTFSPAALAAWLGTEEEVAIAFQCRRAQLDALAAKAAIFLNHGHSSVQSSPAPFNALAVMFPTTPLTDAAGRCRHAAIRKAHLFCISRFTADYVRTCWGSDLKTHVLFPPIYGDAPEPAETRKVNSIVNIGRFNVYGHVKNQHLIVEIFKQLVDRGAVPRDTRLHLVGVVNADNQDNVAYVRDLKLAAAGYDVHFHLGVPRAALLALLREAKVYVHATGYQPAGVAPALACEHYGISILEAMLYRCVPVVFARGGAIENVCHGWNGFLYTSADEAADAIARIFAEDCAAEAWMDNARATATQLGYEGFRESLAAVLAAEGCPPPQANGPRPAVHASDDGHHAAFRAELDARIAASAANRQAETREARYRAAVPRGADGLARLRRRAQGLLAAGRAISARSRFARGVFAVVSLLAGPFFLADAYRRARRDER